MALFHTQNQYTKGGNHSTWWIIKTMVDAGWTIPMSGSGTGGLWTSGNVFDMSQTPKQNSLRDPNGVGVGSEPWGHAYCWAVLEDPSGNRQYIFRRHGTNSDSNDDDWHIGMSYGGRFGEGQTPGTSWDEATQPLAPDNINILGSPPTTTGVQFKTGGDRSLCHIVADSTPSPEGEYGMFYIELTSTNASYGTFFIDDLRATAVGEPFPLAIGLRNNDPNLFNYGTINVNWRPASVFDLGGAGETWLGVYYAWGDWAGVKMPHSGGLGIDGKLRAIAAPVGFNSNHVYIGISRWLYWAPFSNVYPSTVDGQKGVWANQVIIRGLMDGTEYPRGI